MKHLGPQPKKMSIPSGPGIGSPGVVEPVALDFEGTTGTGKLVSHFVKKSFKRRFFYGD
jgi:hypothetical protein